MRLKTTPRIPDNLPLRRGPERLAQIGGDGTGRRIQGGTARSGKLQNQKMSEITPLQLRSRFITLEFRLQISSGRYEVSGDFGVVLQPGLEGLQLPDSSDESGQRRFVFGSTVFRDLSYLAPNCVYPAQKLQARREYVGWEM